GVSAGLALGLGGMAARVQHLDHADTSSAPPVSKCSDFACEQCCATERRECWHDPESMDMGSSPPVAGPRATMVIRMMAGAVFFREGILKFVYANQGVGRFTKLGLPFPVFTANFVGGLEIVGGLLLILGLGTRLITIPFIIELLVAMLSTKPRLFLGTLPLPPPPVPPQVGIWAVLHDVRS